MPPDYRLFEAQIIHPEHSEKILDGLQTLGGVVALGIGALSCAGVAVEAVSSRPAETALLAATAVTSIALGLTALGKDTH